MLAFGKKAGNRRDFLRMAAALGAWGPCALETRGAEPADEPARRIQMAKGAAIAMERRDWEQGILAQALLESGDREGVIRLTRAAMVQRAPDGRLGVVIAGGPTDPAMGGAAYAQAAEWTGEPEMKNAVSGLLDWIRVKAPRTADGILYHVFEGPEIWSDGFNGPPPFLAALGYYDEALKQIEGFKNRLWNAEKGLLAHVWDEGRHQLKDAHFWGGGNGWAAAGLARTIRSLPAERSRDRDRLAGFARQIIDGCMAHQRRDGLFHDVVDDPTTFVETNLAQMLAYAIYLGTTGGWLPGEYRAKADGMRAAARARMDRYGFVQGACSAPNFDRPGISTEAQAFCILMENAGMQR